MIWATASSSKPLRLNREQKGWLLDLTADHVGRRDQRYLVDIDRPGKFRTWFLWDQIPMLLSRTTRTLFTGVGSGVLEIDNALQARVQANPAAIAPVFNQFGTEFETRTRRLIAEGGFEYLPSTALTVTAKVRRTDREGTIPFGGSFGHSSLVELPAPTDHQLTEADAGAEFVRGPLLLRAGYIGSFFHNDVTSVEFDNPFRAIDSASASSRGRLTLAPTNSYNGVNGLASVKLPHRSRASAFVSIGRLTDAGDPIVPQTINSALSPAPIARATVDGEARTTAVNLTFVSRPTRYVDFTAGYRQYDYDNRTPEFAMTQRVSYDNGVSAVNPPVHTEPFGVLRHTLDADFKVTPGGISAGVGFTRLAEERTHRIFESTTDNVVRVTFDTVGNQWFTLRTKYEHAQRRGVGIEEGEQELAAIGEQPGMRHFDIASRDRNRVTVLGSVTPAANVGVSAVGGGRQGRLPGEPVRPAGQHPSRLRRRRRCHAHRAGRAGDLLFVRALRRVVAIASGQSRSAVHRPVEKLGDGRDRPGPFVADERRDRPNRRQGRSPVELRLQSRPGPLRVHHRPGCGSHLAGRGGRLRRRCRRPRSCLRP